MFNKFQLNKIVIKRYLVLFSSLIIFSENFKIKFYKSKNQVSYHFKKFVCLIVNFNVFTPGNKS